MFISVQDAINVVNRQNVTEDEYRLACEYLVDHRQDLQQRVFICLPGGISGNPWKVWEAVKAGSQERCSCGNERVIIPLNPRTEYEAAPEQSIVSRMHPVYLKPKGGDKTSAYIRLDIKQYALTFTQDPFAPFILTPDFFSTKGWKLEQLADVLPGQPKPPVFIRKFADTPTPIFAINAVDLALGTVTITPDAAVEAFDPDKLSDHSCA